MIFLITWHSLSTGHTRVERECHDTALNVIIPVKQKIIKSCLAEREIKSMDKITEFANMIKNCHKIVFFGGAGVSTESGVKDYRSSDGLYNTVNEYGIPPETILSRSFFIEHPEVFYDFYRKYFINNVKPNKAHFALAELEKMQKLRAVITQNIDGLHQMAGSKNVIELHGNASEFYCFSCGRNATEAKEMIVNGKLPKCKKCSGILKPKVVLYEEMLYDGVAENAIQNIKNADMLIVGGTSLAVYPAASFVKYFHGKYTVVINKTETDFDKNADIVFYDSIGKTFESVMGKINI